MLANVSNNTALFRVVILDGLLNSTGIVALAVLLYVVLKEQGKLMARVALGLWLAEAIFYAIIQLGLLALIPLSAEFVAAGAPAGSFYQTLGDFLYHGLYSQGMTLHMWFYCTGGLLWYYLFYRSNYIPRAISIFGLLAVSLGLEKCRVPAAGIRRSDPVIHTAPAVRAGHRGMAPVQRYKGAADGCEPGPADGRLRTGYDKHDGRTYESRSMHAVRAA